MSSRPSRGAARLAAILDALPDALLLVNANGTVVNANSIALEVMESPGTGLVGRGVLDLLPEFDSKLIPGSMRRPGEDEGGRAKPKRMIARRTDGSEFPVEVTSAHLDGRDAYREPQPSYTGDELLMLVVRDLSQTVDTEAELARSQRQTEMILRAAAEGVVGTDTDGRVVLVNPAAARSSATVPPTSATANCTASSSTPAPTAPPSPSRSPRSPTPCAADASTASAGRCCGTRPGSRSPST